MTQNSSRKVGNTDERSTQTLSALRDHYPTTLLLSTHLPLPFFYSLSISYTSTNSLCLTPPLLFHMVFLTVSHTNEIKWTGGLFGNDGFIITIMFE